jgi:hypothetical protein
LKKEFVSSIVNVSKIFTTPAADSATGTLGKSGACFSTHSAMLLPISVPGTYPESLISANFTQKIASGESSLTWMNDSSCNPFKLQSTAPLSDEHVQCCSGYRIRIGQHWHPGGEFDRANYGTHKDEFPCFLFSDEGKERADEDGVADDFKVQLVQEQLQISV